jgi:deoxyhypusine synthase
MDKGPISQFIEKYYLHFNSATVVDAAKGYEAAAAKWSENDGDVSRRDEYG